MYILRLKFKQNVYIVDKGSIEVGQEVEIDDTAAHSFIKANYAEEVIEEKPKAASRKKVSKDGE